MAYLLRHVMMLKALIDSNGAFKWVEKRAYRLHLSSFRTVHVHLGHPKLASSVWVSNVDCFFQHLILLIYRTHLPSLQDTALYLTTEWNKTPKRCISILLCIDLYSLQTCPRKWINGCYALAAVTMSKSRDRSQTRSGTWQSMRWRRRATDARISIAKFTLRRNNCSLKLQML